MGWPISIPKSLNPYTHWVIQIKSHKVETAWILNKAKILILLESLRQVLRARASDWTSENMSELESKQFSMRVSVTFIYTLNLTKLKEKSRSLRVRLSYVVTASQGNLVWRPWMQISQLGLQWRPCHIRRSMKFVSLLIVGEWIEIELLSSKITNWTEWLKITSEIYPSLAWFSHDDRIWRFSYFRSPRRWTGSSLSSLSPNPRYTQVHSLTQRIKTENISLSILPCVTFPLKTLTYTL